MECCSNCDCWQLDARAPRSRKQTCAFTSDLDDASDITFLSGLLLVVSFCVLSAFIAFIVQCLISLYNLWRLCDVGFCHWVLHCSIQPTDSKSFNKRLTYLQKTKSSCYLLSQSHWERYRQKYRPEWENDPLFQGVIFLTVCIRQLYLPIQQFCALKVPNQKLRCPSHQISWVIWVIDWLID